MAGSAINTLVIGLTAIGVIAQYQPVKPTGEPAVAAGNVIGFATQGAPSGARVPIAAGGTMFAIAGAPIALGAALEVHTTVTQVVTKASGVTIGRALTAAANAGDVIEVLLIPN